MGDAEQADWYLTPNHPQKLYQDKTQVIEQEFHVWFEEEVQVWFIIHIAHQFTFEEDWEKWNWMHHVKKLQKHTSEQ